MPRTRRSKFSRHCSPFIGISLVLLPLWLEYMWNLTSSSSYSSSKMRWTFPGYTCLQRSIHCRTLVQQKETGPFTVGWTPWQGPAKMIKPNWLLIFSAAYFQHSAKNLIFIRSCSPNFHLEPAHLSVWFIPHCQNRITCNISFLLNCNPAESLPFLMDYQGKTSL